MSREAMQMALEALELYQSKSSVQMFDDAVKALRQALETEQEPVAWASSLDFDDDDQEIIPAKDKGKLGTSNCDIPLYTVPKQWQGLTDDEIDDCEEEVGMPQYEISSADLYAFAQAIEAKLKEKNHG
jgi:hypothetical protein